MKNVEVYYDELHYFVILGIFSGIYTSTFMFIYSRYLVWKRKTKIKIFANRFYYMGIITTIIALITYKHNNFKFGTKDLINELINHEDLK